MGVGLGNTTILNSTTDLAKKSYAALITRLMPNGSAPLFGMTSMLPTKTALQFEHGYFSKTMLFPAIVVSGAGQLSTDTTFTIVANSNLMPGMMFRNDLTGENIIVNQVLSTTSITVTRAVGTVAAAVVAASQTFSMVGNAFEESSLRPAPLYIVPARTTNYTQIFRNSWGISDTVRATAVIAGSGNVAENKNDAAMFHAVDIEKALFFGQKFLGTRNGQPFHTMDGLVNRILTDASGNITTLAATTNFTQLEAAVDPCFETATDPKVANERVMFVGGTARKVLNAIGRLNGTYFLDAQTNTYGLRYETFRLSRGTFNVVEHPLFNSNATWKKMAVVVDLTSFNIAYLGDRNTKYAEYGTDMNEKEPADNGIDAVGGTFTTECTTEITNPSASAVLYNFTAGAVG